jgi:thymidylate kinase
MNTQNNLIYFSGPHGSGKTTLMRHIALFYDDTVIPELYTRNLKFHTDEKYRKLLKTAGRAIENFEYLSIAKEYEQKNEQKIILANRCIYDVVAYDQVFAKKGWIDEDTFQMLALTKAFFREENEEPYAIIVNPGFDITWRHLHSRWSGSDKKWKEEDMEYCRLACESFEQYRNNDKILYIDKELNLESRVELEPIHDWMKSMKNTSRPLPTMKNELKVA